MSSQKPRTTAIVATTTDRHRAVTLAIGASILMVGAGWAIAYEHMTALFAVIAIVGLTALALFQRGICLGLLLAASMNGLPFIDTSQAVAAKLTLADVAVTAMILCGLCWLFLDRGTYRPDRIGRAVSRAAVPLFLWWFVTLTRSVTEQHVPVLRAAAFGRDFLYFALLLLVLPRARLGKRDIRALLWVVVIAVFLFAVGQIATATGLGLPKGWINFQYTAKQSGLTRVYANMTDLVTASLAVALVASLLARQRIVRARATPIALLLTVSVVVQLTRARWIGLVIGCVVVAVWLIIHNDTIVSVLMRRRLAIIVGTVAIAVILVVIVVPSFIAGGTFVPRLLSVPSDLASGTGTVAAREAASTTATTYLAGKWPLGLGLVPPASHYFAGLPEGSIRDTDLGVLGAIMTVGMIGAILLYAPLVMVLMHCLRRTRGAMFDYDWLCYGGAVWIVGTLAASATLVTLFSTSGLVLTAIILTILSHPSVSPAHDARILSQEPDPRLVRLKHPRLWPLPS